MLFDIIFAGGGTTACVVAGRLIEADPSLNILIVEPGPHIQGLDVHVQPARFFSNLRSKTTLSRHVARPSPTLDDRRLVVTAGKCVGGASGVNLMMYTRASASDYDDWERLGNPGWGACQLIPLAKKLESYTPFKDEIDSHGSSGPIRVSPGGCATSIGRDFLTMASKYDRDRPFTQDTNDFRTCNAYGRWAKYIDNHTGTRSDAAHAYIYDKADNDNLFILTGKHVNRIVFKNGVATGIECVDEQDPALEVVLFQASKLVVLSAGTFGSPTILERSGIGSKEILESQGIPLVADLPGVGENYHDHNSHMPAYFVDDDSDCMTDLYRNVDKAAITPHLDLWRQSGKGLVAHNGIDAGIKIRPTLREVELLGPGFQPLWNSFYAPSPDKPLSFIGPVAGYFGAANVERKIMGMLYYGAYPTSTGRVHISSTDPRAPVDFEFAFYRSEFDILAARYAYKRSREYARRMACYRGDCMSDHPRFLSTSGAALKPFAQPVDAGERDIVYAEEDDTVLDVWHRATVSTSWHSLGTCAMKPREALGVVDPRLDVYGVRNLKIADLSIAPLNVGANTCNTALIIGEKAAGIIIQELGIVSKSRL